jgi:ADP-heptose:LPS heptosyltransferase
VSNILYSLFEKFLSVPENKSCDLGSPSEVLIVRQHNQLGDMLTGISLFRALKEKYPKCRITLIASPANYPAVVKNKHIDFTFNFDKKKLANPFYFYQLIKLLRRNYDLVVAPAVVSISFTSNLLARISKSKIRIGPSALEGQKNKSVFFFDRRVNLDWRNHPDSNVADRILDIVRPFGISTTNYSSEITFDNNDIKTADQFLKKVDYNKKNFLIGIHAGAGKPPNRWSLKKYIAVILKLKEAYPVQFYLTGSSSDKEELQYIKDNLSLKLEVFYNQSIPEVAALVSRSDLFISNDTGIMHVAGATLTPQISIFGPTNPFNWAPVGKNKRFIKKSELIDDVTVEDVFDLCKTILDKKKN